ncbi:hypothetical protein HKX48_000121, partial [Thoreauomyces humboldtii]
MWGGQTSGSNNIPLGPRKRGGDYDDSRRDQGPPPPPAIRQEAYSAPSPVIKEEPTEDRDGRPRKRRSRWGNEEAKTNIPGMPTVIPAGMAPDQLDSYVIHMRLEEINLKLRIGNYVPTERSRSPEPIYGADGKRINTREYRYRKKLEDERHKLVEDGLRRIPGFKPPMDYKRPSKTSDKVYIPVKDYPEINFMGQLIGPRGSTLKRIESESGAKISIRGRGSVKEGKGRSDGSLAPGEEEDLHCLVTADSEDKVKIAMKAIEKVIETAASVPEGQNEMKRMQLRYLAELNGTLRDDENQACQNCGGLGHRRFECPEQKNYTVNLVCRICNGVGHVARDCMQRNDPEALREAEQRDQKLDSEYANLMADIGGGGGSGPHPVRSNHYGPGAPSSGAPAGGRLPWAAPSSAGSGGAAPPPWAVKRDGPPSGPPGGPPSGPPSGGGPAPWQQGHSAPGYGPPGMGPPGGASHHGGPSAWNSQAPHGAGNYQHQGGGYLPPVDYYGGGAQLGAPPAWAPPPLQLKKLL